LGEYRISAGDHSHLLQQARSRQSAQNITDSPQRLGQSIRFSCLRGGDAGQSFRKDLAWIVPIATAKATSLHLNLHRLPLPGQIAQAANIAAVIRNSDPEQLRHRGLPRLRTRKTISRSICSTASHTSNSGSGNDLCQYQWVGSQPQHSKLVKPAPKLRKNLFKYSSTQALRPD
jgi:hypothetical protein